MGKLVRQFSLEVEGQLFPIELRKLPFQEGITLTCKLASGDLITIGDRQLGEHEARRLMAEEIKLRLQNCSK